MPAFVTDEIPDFFPGLIMVPIKVCKTVLAGTPVFVAEAIPEFSVSVVMVLNIVCVIAATREPFFSLDWSGYPSWCSERLQPARKLKSRISAIQLLALFDSPSRLNP